jgi:membrane-associated phospholipid phosphatase
MSKHLFYDWFGYNKKLFHHTHHLADNPTTIKLLEILSNYLGNYLMFPIHLLLLILILTLLIKKYYPQKDVVLNYIKAALVLCISIAITLSLGYILKISLEYSRPYCTHGTILNEMVKTFTEYQLSSCYRSTPSGHSLYSTAFVLSIWPILNRSFKLLSLTILVLVMISRIMLGFHFPADVFYGFCMAALITLGVRKFGEKPLTSAAIKIYQKTHL